MQKLSTRALAWRIRSYVIAAVLSFALQGAFLAHAIEGDSALWWLVWAAVFVLVGFLITVAMISAVPLSREYRRRMWGEK